VKREKEKTQEIAVPDFVGRLIRRLQSKGYEAYVVGGAVRDRCLNHPVSDWDVATSAPPRRIRAVFKNIRSFSLKHETVTLVEEGRHYEVSSFRGGKGLGKAIQEDLAHRDFTINAMAYDATEREIMDPFGGTRDISRKLVKAVGRPGDRFREDPLRLIRAVRIATELGFKIEDRTSRVIAQMQGKGSGMNLSRSSLPENPLEDWICSASSGFFKSSFLNSWRGTEGSKTPIISTRFTGISWKRWIRWSLIR